MTTSESAAHRTPLRGRRFAVLAILGAAGVAVAAGRSDERTLLIELAPVDLDAMAAHHGHPQPRPLRAVFGKAGTLTGYAFEVVDSRGRPVPSEVLHHVKVRAPDRRDLFSPLMLRIAAAGSETDPVRLPRLAGYAFEADDSLLVTAMLHNPTGQAWEGVRVRVRLTYLPGPALTRFAVMPFFMHATPPGEPSDYDLPPGPSVRRHELRPGTAVRLLGVGGHAHRYATALRFEDVTSGRLLWEADLTRDEDGHVLRVSRKLFLGQGGLPLEPDRLYRVTVEYHNPGPDTLHGAGMGTVAGMVRLARGADWPSVDRSSPIYLSDQADEH